MALATSKFTEMPLPLTTHYYSPSLKLKHFLLFTRTSKPSFIRPISSSSIRITPQRSPKPKPNSPRLTPWLDKPNKPPPPPPDNRNVKLDNDYLQNKSQNAIDRIVLRLRNLGIGSDDEDEEEEEEDGEEEIESVGVTGEERLEDLLKREWIRPYATLAEDEGEEDMLPWEKEEKENERRREMNDGVKRRRVKAPTLAEMTIEDEELRRLRRIGMHLRERINVPKAGITQAVLQKIHDKWRKEELVRLKFHEALAIDMKTAHDVVEVGLGSLHFIAF